MNARSTHARRGVLLLIILALLAMFAMIAVAFVVLTGQEKRTAEAARRMGQVTDPPKQTVEQALKIVLRGSNDPLSAVKSWSLMEKIYGHEFIYGSIGNFTLRCGGQLLEFPLADASRHVGAVLTMRDGPAAGLSTRIVGLNPNDPTGAQILPFEGTAIIGGTLCVNGQNFTGGNFIVNGQPYNGMGFGYDSDTTSPTYGTLGAKDGSDPIALMPNHLRNWGPRTGNFNEPDPSKWFPEGGANSDYTAADYQDPLVAMQIPKPGAAAGIPSTAILTPIPSLHRPELVQYWMKTKSASKWQDLPSDLLRKIMFRPMPTDHPQFTGSNPFFNPEWDGVTESQWQWDVDNDGDGVPDSVWVDLGLPVRYTSEGVAYKPLFAILCVDLDGRLNLNAHGTLAQADAAIYGAGVNPALESVVTAAKLAGNPNSLVKLPRGLGYGPAEINLLSGLIDPATNQPAPLLYQKLLAGDSANGISGRYGEPNGMGRPYIPTQTSPRTWNKWFDFAGNAYYHFITQPTTWRSDAYGAPPDLQGAGAVGLDMAGRPLYMGALKVTINGQTVDLPSMGAALTNTPYDIDLRQDAPHALTNPREDNAFGVAEMEQFLRPFDCDATSLPNRICALTSSTPGDPRTSAVLNRRYAFTTESWSVPTVPMAIPPALRSVVKDRPRQLVDLLQSMGIPPDKWATLLPVEMLSGLKLNLNRPLSNWRPSGNDAQFQLCDRPGGLWTGEFKFNATATTDPSQGPTNAIEARQWQARYLYVLMMLLRDQGHTQVFSEAGLDEAKKKELSTRRIAQWAINTVCFSTPDSVMVPFKYDVDPFTKDGWRLKDTKIGPESQDKEPAIFRVVWGCKPPELILTETAASHDRRVADTDFDDGSKKKRTDESKTKPGTSADPDLDQPQPPQGSAFFELYCPRSTDGAPSPTDLYRFDQTTQKWSLDLGRLAPAGGDENLAYPVWRMVISESTITNADNDVRRRLSQKPDSTSLEPKQYRDDPSTGSFSLLTGNAESEIQIDRIVWFTTQHPTTHKDAKRIYYNRYKPQQGGSVDQGTLLPGGQYVVVGPRPVTKFGKIKGQGGGLGAPSDQEIDLENAAGLPVVAYVSGSGTKDYPDDKTQIKQPLGMVCAGDANGFDDGVGISVSEPLYSATEYYPAPKKEATQTLTSKMGVTYKEYWYGDPTGGDEAKGLYLDHPLEAQNSPDAQAANRPIVKEKLLQTGTTPNYKTVFLQRLANPTLPFDAETNPYRTVDWMPIDLTVFNGEDKQPDQWPPAWMTTTQSWDEDDPNLDMEKIKFTARQRGAVNYTPQADFNLWSPVSTEPDTSQKVGGTDPGHIFPYSLRNSLGYINEPFWQGTRPNAWITKATSDTYRGDPLQPFPWLTWNGRPFISEYELLSVPSSYPARLLWEYQFITGGTPNPYAPPSGGGTMPFPHLLDFFWSRPEATNAPPNLYRLLDYVGVPSRFIGTELEINPARAANAEPHWFHPPFNRVSNYREPGRINLNTIASPEVFRGLMNDFPGMNTDELWKRFVRSRRGYASPNSTALDPTGMAVTDASYPSRLTRPFRSATGASMMASLPGIEYTLLRSDLGHDGDELPNPPSPRPLFEFDGTLANFDPALNTAQLVPIMNPNRNPYFRYQGIQRLGNLVTTRSNVFAVWITVGYFQAIQLPAGYDKNVYPDGYTLGPELGLDTGEVNRHRGFYILDRSIPVGFTRGQDLNVDRAVLLRKFIE